MSDEKKYNCPTCNRSYSTKTSLSQYVNAKHKKIQCKFCNKEFESQNDLAQHLLDGKCESKKLNKNVKCNYCNRKFKTTDALKQHINAKHEKQFVCSICGKGFQKEQSLIQHFDAKHENLKNIDESKTQPNKKPKVKPELGVYEHISLAEKIKIIFKKIINNTKILLIDECVGNDETIIKVLENRYQVIPMPNNLLSHEDKDLRLIIKEKRWGLISKDFEMVVNLRKLKIKPVYFLKEVRDHRALIKISKRNYEVS